VSAFWPPTQQAQAEYEALRQAALAGTPLLGRAALRFERMGLAGLITRSPVELDFMATVIGATRPAWNPYRDPRVEALGAAYALLLSCPSPNEVVGLWEVG
jgi:hypothetical protein